MALIKAGDEVSKDFFASLSMLACLSEASLSVRICASLAVGVREASVADMRPFQPVHGPCSYMGDGTIGSSSHVFQSCVMAPAIEFPGESAEAKLRLGVIGT